jgi:hypothetical protein
VVIKYKRYEDYHRIENGMEQKRCQDCNDWFDMNEDNFGIVRKNNDGFNVRCKTCQKTHQKDYYNKYKINGALTGKTIDRKKMKSFNNYTIQDDITIIHIENTKGEKFEAIIDTEELQLLKELDLFWHIRYAPDNQSYYAMSGERYIDERGIKKGRSRYLHIEIMKQYSDLKGKHIDHINHNTLDNRKENLRVIEQKKNLSNRKGANSNNKTGVRNVCHVPREHCYRVQITKNYKRYKWDFPEDQFEEACKFAEEKRKEIFGEFAGKG